MHALYVNLFRNPELEKAVKGVGRESNDGPLDDATVTLDNCGNVLSGEIEYRRWLSHEDEIFKSWIRL